MEAERQWADVPCGVMDQFISVLGKENHLMLLDCKKLEPKLVPFDGNSSSPVVVIINSNVHHNLGSSEYPVRVKQCNSALAAIQHYYNVLQDIAKSDPSTQTLTPSRSTNNMLNTADIGNQIKSLRDVTIDMLETVRNERPSSSRSTSVDGDADSTSLPIKSAAPPVEPPHLLGSVVYRRARHVISENARVLDTVQALGNRDWSKVGRLMTESHASLSADYEVCKCTMNSRYW